MAAKRQINQRTIPTDVPADFKQAAQERPDYVEPGSKEHALALGVMGEKDPVLKANLEAALTTPFVPSARNTKIPINRRTYRKGDMVYDGFKRTSD